MSKLPKSIPMQPKEKVLVIREGYTAICDGDIKASILLSILSYWHDVKLSMQDKNIQANKVAEKHGEEGTQDTTLYQFHSTQELIDSSFGLLNQKTIVKAKQLLVEKGFISLHKNPNPRYTFDNTTFFMVYPDTVISALSSTQKMLEDTVKNAGRNSKNYCNNTIDNFIGFKTKNNTPGGASATDISFSEAEEEQPVEVENENVSVNRKRKPKHSPVSAGGDTGEVEVKEIDEASLSLKDVLCFDCLQIAEGAAPDLSDPPLPFKEACVDIIKYLNKIAKKRFAVDAKSTWKLLNILFQSGYTPAQIKNVIHVKTFGNEEYKIPKWLNDSEWDGYLRPSTLFKLENFEKTFNLLPADMAAPQTEKEKAQAKEQQKWEAYNKSKEAEYLSFCKKYAEKKDGKQYTRDDFPIEKYREEFDALGGVYYMRLQFAKKRLKYKVTEEDVFRHDKLQITLAKSCDEMAREEGKDRDEHSGYAALMEQAQAQQDKKAKEYYEKCKKELHFHLHIKPNMPELTEEEGRRKKQLCEMYMRQLRKQGLSKRKQAYVTLPYPVESYYDEFDAAGGVQMMLNACAKQSVPSPMEAKAQNTQFRASSLQ